MRLDENRIIIGLCYSFQSDPQWCLSRRHHCICGQLVFLKILEVGYTDSAEERCTVFNMSAVLQQTLRGLCFDTGWCYAVFWKLKQQARTVLTWEDAFYELKTEDINANPLATTMPGFGQQACGGRTDEGDPIGLLVSKMSYHVYSVGEGIIGRVAFTNKHQWVFSSSNKGTAADGVFNRKTNSRMQPEKYPSGWEHQFAAGIKTIAVIAVPQGVVQLGATQMITEDLKLIGHVKAVFGTLQIVPGAFLSDLVSDVQRGRVRTVYPLAVPAPQLPRDPALINIASLTLARVPSLPLNMGLATTTGVVAFNSSLGYSGAGRLLPSQQMLTHAHSMPLPPVHGFQGSVPHCQHSLRDKPGLESLSQPSFSSVKPSCTWAGPVDMWPAKVGTSPPQPGIVKPPISSTGSLTANPQTGIISHLSLSPGASSIAIPVSAVALSPQADNSSYSSNWSLTGGKDICEHLRALSQSRPVLRKESPGRGGGGYSLVGAELSDINSSIGSPKVVIRTAKENPTCVIDRSWVENTQRTDCKASIECKQLASARPPGQCSQLVLGRFSAERHLDSNRHSAKCQQLDSYRSLTESQQMDTSRSSVEVRHLDLGSASTESGQLVRSLDGNRLTKDSPQLVSPLPLNNCFSLRSGQFGGASIATQKYLPASQRSSGESSQPGDSELPISSNSEVFGGLSMHLERSTISTMKHDSCGREFFSVSAEALPLPSERGSQTFASESSHLTVQMSDLLQLAKQFEKADSEDPKGLSSKKVDLHESISSSILCDDYFENMQSSRPLVQNLELHAGEFGSAADSLTQSLFNSELDDFDEFFALLTKAEKNKSPQPDVFFASTSNNEVLASLSTQDCVVITEGKEQYANQTSGSRAAYFQIATAQEQCEPIMHTLATNQPLSNWSADEETLSCKEVANIQSEPQADRFVNSRIQPEVSFPCFRPTDSDMEMGCQEMTVLPPASRQHKIVKKGKKRSRPGEDGRARSRDRQQIQDLIQKLRSIVSDGATCSIDTLLEKAVEYTKFLQTVLQDSGKRTQSTKLQIHDGSSVIGIGSEVSSVNASWVMDFGAEGRACPILVENLSQPGQMLVEMLCEEHGFFLEIADCIKSLGLTILKGVMEARSDKVWARFLIVGPQDVHRVQVLWSLMQLLGSNKTR